MEDVFGSDGPDAADQRTSGSDWAWKQNRPGALAEDDALDIRQGTGTGGLPIEDPAVRLAVAFEVREALHELGAREREVIRLRFGLDDTPMVVEEVAERLSLSADRVRQIETRAINKLRRSHKPRELRSTLN
jgi:RNA polymerase sigma factor (sigma-70 family)